MAAPAPDRWQKLSPYLDQALTLTDEERVAWLAELRRSDAELANELQSLLDENRAIANEKFLETGPPKLPTEAGLAGQTIGAYRLKSPLGQGGMGSVWLAERSDGRFQRRAAVKFIHLSLLGHGGEERFKREGSILGRVSHPNVAQLLDAGVTAGGQPYLVLEHVEGQSIDQYCDAKRLGIEDRLLLFLEVLGAVAHAHANLVVHRDLKPSNVLVRSDGQVKLLDFGIAKLLEQEGGGEGATLLTQQGGGALTPAFAAPEQITAAPVTTATDVYALGVLLFVLLAGQHPAGAGSLTTADLVKATLDLEPPRASEVVASERVEVEKLAANAAKRGTTPEKLRKALRGDLDTIVAKALKKNPGERYGSVTAFADDLRRYLQHESISAQPDTLAYRFGKFVRRNRAATALATVALFATLAGVAGTLMQARTARQQRDAAYRERDRANRITDFMTGLFKVSDPDQTVRTDVTAREILDKGAKDITSGLSKDPKLQTQMMHVMGNAYMNLGLYDRAQTLMERAIETGRASGNAEDPETLSTMENLGYVLVQEGQAAEGEKLERHAWESLRRQLGPEHPTTLQAESDLAGTLALEGRLPEAEKLAREALEAERRVLGLRDQHTLSVMDILAIVLAMQGRFAESVVVEKEVIDVQRGTMGPEYKGTLMSQANLADTLYLMGQYGEVKQVLQQTLDAERHTLGVHHPETARSVYNLGCVAAHDGKRDEAFALFDRALPDLSLRNVPDIANDPELKSLHSDPRFSKLVARAKARGPVAARCPL